MTKKRNIFGELMDGVAAMKAHRDGETTLPDRKVEPQELEKILAQGRIRRLRGKVRWEGDLEQSRRSRVQPARQRNP